MKDRVLRDFKPEDIAKVADTFHAWQRSAPSPAGLIFTHNRGWMRPQGEAVEGVGQRRYTPW
jgi:hypothetical protein